MFSDHMRDQTHKCELRININRGPTLQVPKKEGAARDGHHVQSGFIRGGAPSEEHFLGIVWFMIFPSVYSFARLLEPSAFNGASTTVVSTMGSIESDLRGSAH